MSVVIGSSAVELLSSEVRNLEIRVGVREREIESQGIEIDTLTRQVEHLVLMVERLIVKNSDWDILEDGDLNTTDIYGYALDINGKRFETSDKDG